DPVRRFAGSRPLYRWSSPLVNVTARATAAAIALDAATIARASLRRVTGSPAWRWLPARRRRGASPRGGGRRPAADHQPELEERRGRQVAEVSAVERGEGGVGAGDAEERSEECQRSGRGRRQRAPDTGGGPGRRQREPAPPGLTTTNWPIIPWSSCWRRWHW